MPIQYFKTHRFLHIFFQDEPGKMIKKYNIHFILILPIEEK